MTFCVSIQVEESRRRDIGIRGSVRMFFEMVLVLMGVGVGSAALYARACGALD